jgi:predicted transcriptional regulator
MIDETKLEEMVLRCIRRVLDERAIGELMTKTEVAELLECSERTITNYMARKGLPYETRHGRPAFRREQVLAWHVDHGPLHRLKSA